MRQDRTGQNATLMDQRAGRYTAFGNNLTKEKVSLEIGNEEKREERWDNEKRLEVNAIMSVNDSV